MVSLPATDDANQPSELPGLEGFDRVRRHESQAEDRCQAAPHRRLRSIDLFRASPDRRIHHRLPPARSARGIFPASAPIDLARAIPLAGTSEIISNPLKQCLKVRSTSSAGPNSTGVPQSPPQHPPLDLVCPAGLIHSCLHILSRSNPHDLPPCGRAEWSGSPPRVPGHPLCFLTPGTFQRRHGSTLPAPSRAFLGNWS